MSAVYLQRLCLEKYSGTTVRFRLTWWAYQSVVLLFLGDRSGDLDQGIVSEICRMD